MNYVLPFTCLHVMRVNTKGQEYRLPVITAVNRTSHSETGNYYPARVSEVGVYPGRCEITTTVTSCMGRCNSFVFC